MMSEYYPNNWVVLKLKADKGTYPIYKVLADWRLSDECSLYNQ